ncbi:class I SAM-dependent methyltransferase [Hymenobacter sp. BT507]|uniref:Class I SAM-dependent methyltransferase n=1 Tax=Hymenobacter citatus TaxID=2763506 RepID=A0ABR7MKR3_9BACT|nr:class I SAM-dependent methyltransferase [Hymenobacter citatus]MBC6611646.1 class I SAM-dependent methyltransferase [Hymenobacter citatus]
MNWHETIAYIRENAQYAELVKLAYFDEDLRLNVERFGASEEYSKTIDIIRQYAPSANTILDVGAGNGISSINFALSGYTVTVVEPDSSDSVGANAIRRLQQNYQLDNLTVYESFAEEVGFAEATFDIVYVRQAMHHAYDLDKFLIECARVLKPGGLLITIRDHVIFDEQDKAWFLESHPLHKFYGGENAFTLEEYTGAMSKAKLLIKEVLKFYDSPINYYPFSTSDLEDKKKKNKAYLLNELKNKIGFAANIPILLSLYRIKNGFSTSWLNEKQVPGRMYSFICQKL